ncbi:MAG: FAD-dependent oxidoreductase [Chloroflexi bacterium]|nr:FAD-dependent oxidoreductase [Chloroflexota bacterium]MBI4330506.1 FAD-dependent oxidoreductase [Chloroflexota bacterium]
MYDLAIVGGGPAAMTAAVYAARKKLDIILVAKDIGGQATLTSVVENYMGYQYIEGSELMEKFADQVKQFPITQKVGESVVNISTINRSFEVKTESGQAYQARAVIFASGKRPRQLNVPGEDRLRGRGVTYCAICDGPLFAGMKVAIVGGGNSALEATNDMVKIAEHVYLVSITPLTCDPILAERAQRAPNLSIFTEHQVVEILGQDQVEAMVIKPVKGDKTTSFEVRGVFVEIGLEPNSEPVKGLVQLNKLGEVMVDSYCRTSVPGLFSAGDVTDVPEKQIVVAAGEGSKAALEAQRYLLRIKD